MANLKHLGTADWDRERSNMYVNTPASWSAHALKTGDGDAGDAVWAGRLARVSTLKCLTHVGHRDGEPTVLGSGPCRGHCIILNVGKDGV